MSKELKQPFYDTSFTLKGRIFHPNLLKTRTRTTPKGSREVFDVMFAWNPAEPANQMAFGQLMQFIETQKGICFPGIDPRALVNPIKAFQVQGFTDYVKQDYSPNPEYLRGHLWINAETGSDRAPMVVMENRQPVMSDAEVYSGRNAVLNFSLYPMLFDPQDRQKKIGFGVNLTAVMLLQGGDREGGKVQVDVNKVFGNFAQDMGMAPQFGAPGQFNAPGAQAPQQNFQAPPAAPQQPWGQPPQQNWGNAPAPSAPMTSQFPGQANQSPAHAQGPSNGQQPPWMPNGPQNFNPGHGR